MFFSTWHNPSLREPQLTMISLSLEFHNRILYTGKARACCGQHLQCWQTEIWPALGKNVFGMTSAVVPLSFTTFWHLCITNLSISCALFVLLVTLHLEELLDTWRKKSFYGCPCLVWIYQRSTVGLVQLALWTLELLTNWRVRIWLLTNDKNAESLRMQEVIIQGKPTNE